MRSLARSAFSSARAKFSVNQPVSLVPATAVTAHVIAVSATAAIHRVLVIPGPPWPGCGLGTQTSASSLAGWRDEGSTSGAGRGALG